MFVKAGAFLLFLMRTALAQTSGVAGTSAFSNSPPAQSHTQTNQGLSLGQRIEKARWDCIQSRRIICGKILKVLPDGLVIDSGYTNLMRPPLNRSWLVPETVNAQRAANLVEGNQADSVCVGLVFLTDLPNKPVAKTYEYVILAGYPTGHYTYTSVGDVRRTVRRFSAKLAKAVQWKLDESQKP